MKVSFDLAGFKCDPPIRPFLQKVFAGEYDVDLPVQWPTILDCGANCGAFTIWASHRWPGATIHAYEPHPKTFKVLCENTDLVPNLLRYECGVGKAGLTPLWNGENNSGEATIFPGNRTTNWTGQHVTIIDPLQMPEADILKMDTEGCEVDILRPLIEAGRTFKAVLLEYHRAEDRRLIDALLPDYVLVGASVTFNPDIGILKYLHPSVMREL